MDKLVAINSFVEVAGCGSFTQAAERLGLSRIQVSRHVQDVEDWLGQRLLHRTTRSVSLTVPGEEALKHCERILNEASELVSSARRHNAQLSGTIRVASPIGLGQNLLFEAVDEFTRRHPGIRVDLLLADRFASLVDERIDVAIRYTDQPDDTLIARRLLHIETAICASPEYLAQFGEPATPAELAGHNCLVHLAIERWPFVDGHRTDAIQVAGNLRANDMGVLIRAALLDRGIVRLPCDLANPLLQSGQLRDVLTEVVSPGQSLWAVYLSRSYQQPEVRAFIDFLAAHWPTDLRVWRAS